MAISRRHLLRRASWFAFSMLGTLGVSSVSAGSNKLSGSAPADSKDSVPGFDEFLRERGYVAVSPAPLLTGHPFNGGLRYDDIAATVGDSQYIKQQCARVEDAGKKGTPGTLPLFTIIGLNTSTPALARTASNLFLEYLTKVVQLDPARLRVTTTDNSAVFFPLLAKWGITAKQIRIRQWQEAVTAGSGSGYFAPDGHPDGASAPSYSLEYVMPNGSEIEIAEITHDPAGISGRSSGGIGVERVEMARTGQPIAWADRLALFNRLVNEESSKTNVMLPPGVAAINN